MGSELSFNALSALGERVKVRGAVGAVWEVVEDVAEGAWKLLAGGSGGF
jgi:hypothetical protein